MKKLLLLLILAIPVYSQTVTTTAGRLQRVTSDPTGQACGPADVRLYDSQLYTCQAGAYALQGGASVSDATFSATGKAPLGLRAEYATASLPTCNSSNKNKTVNVTDGNKGQRTCRNTTGSTYAWVDDKAGVYYLADFGGGPSAGAATNDTALSNILSAIDTAGVNSTIIYPDGETAHSTSFTIGRGVVIRGASGAQGSTPGQGASITHNSNGNLFTWDGTGGSGVGTGGGIRDMLITKGNGYSGGTAIKLLATSDSLRPGEMIIDNVLIYGQGTGLWAKGISIDGTAANTAGTRGVRSVHFRKVRVADCTTNNRYVEINQGTHIFGDIQLDQGDGTGTLGATVEGFWDDLMLKISGGNLVVTHTGTPGSDVAGMVIEGNLDSFSNSYSSVIGSVIGRVTTVTNSATTLTVIQNGVLNAKGIALNNSANSLVATLIAGSVRGLRLGTDTSYARVESVDPTGVGSYQPLWVNGTTVDLASSNTTIAQISSGGMTITDAKNIAFNTTTGTKFGTSTSQKLAFFNSTPIVQPANTVAINDVLVSLGLRASGGTSNFTSTVALTNATVTATGSGTTTLDLSTGNIRTVTMPAGNTTIALSNVPVGDITIFIIQDSGGSRTVTWPSAIKWVGGSSPTLTTAANRRDGFGFVCDGTNCYEKWRALNIF